MPALTRRANAMRFVLALGLLITLCGSADAATVLHSKRHVGHSRPAQRVPVGHFPPAQPVTVPKGYAVPGWTDEQTQDWLNNATGPKD
jgi:hypothetical protein